jgi:hypothetical protein
MLFFSYLFRVVLNFKLHNKKKTLPIIYVYVVQKIRSRSSQMCKPLEGRDQKQKEEENEWMNLVNNWRRGLFFFERSW